MIDFGKLADFFAGEPEPPYSPSVRGMAESDSSDGEVEVYLGEVEQVYQTSLQPLYEVDEDGDIVYDDEGLPVQMVDGDGQPMTAMQTVYDEDGNPVPELDSDGFPVFEKVQLLDADGDPIVEYDADGNPVAQTDQQGNPVYLEDEDGNRIPELDEAGEVVYERDPETGETILDEDDNPVPVYQVAPVEESQVAVIETIGTVRAGETPVISMGGAASTAIAAGGWGDSIETTFAELGDSVTVAQTVADEANAIATATNQHFWTDTAGSHVTDVTQGEWTTAAANDFADQTDLKPYHNSLWNSAGMLFRRALKNLVSISKSAIAFFDGEGNDAENIVARFGSDGAEIRNGKTEVDIASGDMTLAFDGDQWFKAETSDTLKEWETDSHHLIWGGDVVSIMGQAFPYQFMESSSYPVEAGTIYWALKGLSLSGERPFISVSYMSSSVSHEIETACVSGWYLALEDLRIVNAVPDQYWSLFCAGTAERGVHYFVLENNSWDYREPFGTVSVNGDVDSSVVTASDHVKVGNNKSGLLNITGDEIQFSSSSSSGVVATLRFLNGAIVLNEGVGSVTAGNVYASGDLTAGGEVGDGDGNTLSDKADASDVYSSSASRTANTVLAAPNGSAGAAAFRALVAADIPSLPASKIGSGTFAAARIPSLKASKISDMADHIVTSVHRTSFTSINNTTSAYTSAGATGWSYHVYSSGIVHAWGIVNTASMAITSAVGNYYRTSADRHLRLPVAMSYIESIHFGFGMGGGAAMGITASPSGTTSTWQSGTYYSIPFRYIAFASVTGATYVPVEIWGVKAS